MRSRCSLWDKKSPNSLCCLTITERFHLTSSCCSCLPLCPSVYLLTVVNIQPAAGGEWTWWSRGRGGSSRSREPGERQHKDRVMKRNTEREREEAGLVNYSPRSAVGVLLLCGVVWCGCGLGDRSFKRLKPNWATEQRIRRSGQIWLTAGATVFISPMFLHVYSRVRTHSCI